MDLVQPDADPIKFMSSLELDSSQDKDLLSVSYTRIQQQSPQFFSVYDGIEQKVDVKISTFIFRAAPEPVLTLYDFIMTTFVPQPTDQIVAQPAQSGALEVGTPKASNAEGGKIHVAVKLASVQGKRRSWSTHVLSNSLNSCTCERASEPGYTVFIDGRR